MRPAAVTLLPTLYHPRLDHDTGTGAMRQQSFLVQFTTPAFLGNADQAGQWRTPPFKALLRQWWRMAYVQDQGFNIDTSRMRREEGLLFGNAWLSHQEQGHTVKEHCRSLVRLRLDRWSLGQETNASWGYQDRNRDKVKHREKGNIGPLLYLGWGPLGPEKLRTSQGQPEYVTILKKNAAIQAAEIAKLQLAYPTTHRSIRFQALCESNAPRIERALWWVDRFGTLGGRSRNGWGSFTLAPTDPAPKQAAESIAALPLHP